MLSTIRGRGRSRLYSLRRQSAPGKVMWVSHFAPASHLSGGGMVVGRTRVFVTTYSRIANGTKLWAFSLGTGKKLWGVTLEAIGPIAHSRYSNRAQLRVIGGHPVVFGNEARRYIEQRSAATGGKLFNRKLPMQRVVRHIGEPLYRELNHMLKTRRTYAVTLSGFLSRHGLPVAQNKANRARPFRSAVRHLSNRPIVGRRFKLRLSLVPTRGSTDFWVRARRIKAGP